MGIWSIVFALVHLSSCDGNSLVMQFSPDGAGKGADLNLHNRSCSSMRKGRMEREFDEVERGEGEGRQKERKIMMEN